MPSPEGDPTYIRNKERFFMTIASTISLASSHPTAPGGCVVVRDREVIGDGRSFYTASKVEIDCFSHAIATAAKRGTPTPGSVIYSTRYPFSHSVFQCYVMGIRMIYVQEHDWESCYKHEFRQAARLARELGVSIETMHRIENSQYSTNSHADQKTYADLTGETTFAPDEFDIADTEETNGVTTSI